MRTLKSRFCFFIQTVSVILIAGTAAATTWNNATDWSMSANPNGVWSYGWTASLAADAYFFVPYDGSTEHESLELWRIGDTVDPNVLFNPSSEAFNAPWGHEYPPMKCTAGPGPDNVSSMFRWTAPANGWYEFTTVLNNCVTSGTATTSTHVVLNQSRELAMGQINGEYATHTLQAPFVQMQAGDTLDFSVSPDGNYFSDTTGVDIFISDTTAPLQTWTLFDGFSPTANPNGQWVSGYAPNIDAGYTLTTYTTFDQPQDLDRWHISPENPDPCAGQNPFSTPLTCTWNATYPVGTNMLHPGPTGELSAYRWTADEDGTYVITANMFNVVVNGYHATTDVHVIKNATEELFVDNVEQGHSWVNFVSDEVSLSAGNTIDFLVGWGSNGSHSNDSTGITAQIAQVSDVVYRIPGDANEDGNVDVTDLGILATNYEAGGGFEWGDGDFNDDGLVNVIDLGLMATNYGYTSPSVVPEPSVLCMLFLGAIAIALRSNTRLSLK